MFLSYLLKIKQSHCFLLLIFIYYTHNIPFYIFVLSYLKIKLNESTQIHPIYLTGCVEKIINKSIRYQSINPIGWVGLKISTHLTK